MILGRALRIGLYAILGWLGLYGTAIPLFGYLGYIGALLFPLVVLIEVAGAVVALIKRGRWAWIYPLGNIGVLMGNIGVVAGTFMFLTVGSVGQSVDWQPNTDVTRPLYLAFTLLGLVVGVAAGARMERPAP